MIFQNNDFVYLLKNLNGKRLVLFGAGNTAKQFIASLDAIINKLIRDEIANCRISNMFKSYIPISACDLVDFCLDNDRQKRNSTFEYGEKQILICNPEVIEQEENFSEKYIIVITSVYFLEIYLQLSKINKLESTEVYVSRLMQGKDADYGNFFKEIIKKPNICNYKERMESLRNIHKGERCFIIGNGPSLIAKDLDCLKKEYTFAVNRIWLMFKDTDWRPTYYAVIDQKHFESSFEDIQQIDCKCKFMPLFILRELGLDVEDAYYFNLDTTRFYPKLPSFSSDISDRVFDGMTVTYSLIQIAAFMGFKQIYLIGQDHSFSREMLPDGSVKINNGVKNYFSENYTKSEDRPGAVSHMNLAYEKARMYCESNSIEIYNATRGGKLEIFERVNFDELF